MIGTTTYMSFYTNVTLVGLSAHLQGHERRIYSGHVMDTTYDSTYEILHADSWIILTIFNTSCTDAGRYVWIEPKHNRKKSAQLIVFGIEFYCL